jgi:hypothetical protein
MQSKTEDQEAYIKLLMEAKEDLKIPNGISYHEFRQRLTKYNVKQHPETLYKAIYSLKVVSTTKAWMPISSCSSIKNLNWH